MKRVKLVMVMGCHPALGHFAQADSIIPGGVQGYDRYAYVGNSPINYTDPSGHKPACGVYGEECAEDELDALTGGNNSGGGNNNGGNNPQDMETSDEGKGFIKYWEDDYYAQYPYPDKGADRNCTIGWGHFLQKNGCGGWTNKTWYYDKDPKKDRPLSLTEAEDFFESDIVNAEKIIKRTITADLTQAQFDAMVDYIFNTGEDKFKAKGIPGLLNSGNYQEAAKRMESGPYDSGGIKFDKLIERRQAEAALFLLGTYGNYVP